MHLYMSLFVAVLFVALTPGILLSVPAKGSKITKAMVHGLVFALVFHFTHRMIWNYFYGRWEGFFTGNPIVTTGNTPIAAKTTTTPIITTTTITTPTPIPVANPL